MEFGTQTLSDEMSGSYAVRTGSGSLYAIRLDPPREVVRLAEDLAPSPRYSHVPPSLLRRDGETIELLKIVRMEIGQRGLMWLDVRRDGVPTLRTTAEVESITRLQAKQKGAE